MIARKVETESKSLSFRNQPYRNRPLRGKIRLNLGKGIRTMTEVDRGKASVARVTRKQAFR